ncbi:MAG: deoxyribodipyrimidine photo-lyase [Desulfobacteraceae bacterium]
MPERRIQVLNNHDIRSGDYVLYWMQQSQRVEHNPALDMAIGEANRLKQPLVVGFGLTDAYPEANLRHFTFMLEGLQEVQSALQAKGIRLAVRLGEPPQVALELGKQASLIVCDVGYTRHQRQWRRIVADQSRCRVVQVESDAVVPVAVVSDKAEYAARTLRPRINKHLDDYLKLRRATRPRRTSMAIEINGIDLVDIDRVISRLDIDRSVPSVSQWFKGGTREAKKQLRRFLRQDLAHYETNANQPQTDHVSHMSPYLHFGQISPVYLALQIQKSREGLGIDRAAFLEQLIVRRELAINFVHYTEDYGHYTCVPEWARKTLADHAQDRRTTLYDRQALEAACTHDPYWNAAMQEMKHTGYMHNYMRMYWGKKILEWTQDPEEAFKTTLAINNKYFLDGRDPNSYAGVVWIFGKHDRPWPERPIFGKVRYMAASGLERKCDIQAYLQKVNRRISA